MKNKHKIVLRVTSFALVFLILFYAVNNLFQPIWTKWNNYYTTNGFYEEPENTIETLFFGASIGAAGCTPVELYEKYGMCAYSLATQQQPVLASYYWLEEAYKYHSKTLKTVVFEVSQLRTVNADATYHKALDMMKLSKEKIKAIRDHLDGGITDILSYLIPLNSYHGRWTELSEVDFKKNDLELNNGTRGYNFELKNYTDKVEYENIEVKNPVLDVYAEPTPLEEEAKFYLDKMANFCKEKGLTLLLMKTPTSNWNSALNRAIQELADKYELDYLDFNYEPLYSQIDYIHPYDSFDGNHMNYYGATKLTEWLGQYLVDYCGATDVRGNEKYAFMEEQLSRYDKLMYKRVELFETDNVIDYLKSAFTGKYTVFITVRDEGTAALTENHRSYFESVGLEQLSVLEHRDSYVAVIKNGKVEYEATKKATDTDLTSISHSGRLSDKNIYRLTSGGFDHGDIASCKIDGTDYAKNNRGLNIVVYNEEYSEVIASVSFDTHIETTRDRYTFAVGEASKDEKKTAEAEEGTALYNVADYRKKVTAEGELQKFKNSVGENNVFGYLNTYKNDSDKVIMFSVKDDASYSLTDADRKKLAGYGFNELAKLEYRDSYIAYMEGGKVKYEARNHGLAPITHSFTSNGVKFTILSGGCDSGNTSSILANGEECSFDYRGINIVVYDKVNKVLYDSICFDTYKRPISQSTELFDRADALINQPNLKIGE